MDPRMVVQVLILIWTLDLLVKLCSGHCIQRMNANPTQQPQSGIWDETICSHLQLVECGKCVTTGVAGRGEGERREALICRAW